MALYSCSNMVRYAPPRAAAVQLNAVAAPSPPPPQARARVPCHAPRPPRVTSIFKGRSRRILVRPLKVAMQEQPWRQTIGLLNQPVAQVSSAMYDVWAWAHLAPQL